MILGFRDKRTERFADGEFVPAFKGFERQGWKRLEILDAPARLPTSQAFPATGWKP